LKGKNGGPREEKAIGTFLNKMETKGGNRGGIPKNRRGGLGNEKKEFGKGGKGEYLAPNKNPIKHKKK